jgi:hypothetical protein
MRLIGLAVVLALGQLLVPLRADGQPAGKVPALGFLFSRSSAAGRDQDEAFRKGMDELGYVEGRHYTVERRYADGCSELLPRLAAELVRLRVDVIGSPLVKCGAGGPTSDVADPDRLRIRQRSGGRGTRREPVAAR